MNPFRPTAGKMPPILIGREADVADFFHALNDGAGAPGRLMLVTGQRGYGKTVLLTQLSRVAIAQGWPVISETASAGMCARIAQELSSRSQPRIRAEISPSISVAGMVDVSLGALTRGDGAGPTAALTLRKAIELALERVDVGKGVCIAVDEVQASSRSEMVALGTAVQHVIEDQDLLDVPDEQKKGVALVLAGLPSLIDDLLDDRVLTFLRRSQHHWLGPVPTPSVRNAYIQTFRDNGRELGHQLASEAAERTGGFPYMVQLLGYYIWQAMDVRHATKASAADLEQATIDAVSAFEDAVCAPTLRGLTKAQRRFVEAMVPDMAGGIPLVEVACRADKSLSWARKYAESLKRAQVVRNENGNVAFDIPHFAEYLARVMSESGVS